RACCSDRWRCALWRTVHGCLCFWRNSLFIIWRKQMIDSRTAPYAALVLRLALGIMFLAHGLTKVFVFTPAGTAGFFQSIGFPGFLAYPVMAFEVLGGLLLILGVFTRPIAMLAVVQLFVASTAHFANGW